jgi:hypothetical protein
MESQRCGGGGKLKPIDEFNIRNRATGKHHTTCKQCQKTYKRNHYLRHLAAYKERSARQKTERIDRSHRLLAEYLATHPCVDCRESDITVLEFDHIQKKDRHIARIINDGVLWEKILVEIAKCEVRCANCHKRKTAKQFGWWKYKE